MKPKVPLHGTEHPAAAYDAVLSEVVGVLETARRASARAVNSLMTATYREVGRRIVVYEQAGEPRAAYGQELLKKLAQDLVTRFGRGFSTRNLEKFRAFYLNWPVSSSRAAESVLPDFPREMAAEEANLRQLRNLTSRFRLPWSHYVRLLSVESPDARRFYEAEALRSGWTVCQLDRQVSTQFYERTLLSRNKASMLRKAEAPDPGEALTPDQILKLLPLLADQRADDLESDLLDFEECATEQKAP